MDFRPAVITKIDLLTSRIQKRGPGFVRNDLARELEGAFRRHTGKLEFIRFMDAFQTRLYAKLLKTYRNELFAQALALKLANLAIAKFHFLHRHSLLVSGPLQLTVDPTNVCQLACPGCVHTENPLWTPHVDWPGRALPTDVFENFLERTAPFAFCEMLYNYGEPLLHKRFTDFVRAAKKYLLFTMTSTNLSMPLKDPEDIVASGLDRMVVSIDGTTQQIYEKYRRHGRLDLVFDNVRRLVQAKKTLRSPRPYLIWQFLTFAHNAHQVEDAIARAREFGMNEIAITTPFAVDQDDPTIRAVDLKTRGSYTFERWDGKWCSPGVEVAPQIAQVFAQPWEERLNELPIAADESMPSASTCDWLYNNITIDGAARLMPCCMAPDKQERNLVFANFDSSTDSTAIVNSRMATLARLSFANRQNYESETAGHPETPRPYCASCKQAPHSYGLANVAGDIRTLDYRGAIPRSLTWELIDWA